ncbi:uncharacterized protein MONOS_7016 [Monocercomonoides exilis]|uniref:uncharacterized protein n=1 Tax=Monocercomonoides exilis TaxID=2049356 RepID=UPI00355ABEFC|nr:hypothetical protein MONOS_7016 [Monocercomonoides exilis]|eukprot:MONOS_7016.1-p1 / transcript=MONOS_7016.1 / gene=MONOS_7016 / organism=Monocercomonoides_exilis_PA203 / gene_product=unspecified product / transcript_product=unspecified product / location=Mono_scaffold00231:35137-37205(+) / protein_length=621 / sequence_SO=supercontig / SO=protein_coding / is_pseudo=false
MSQFGQNWGRGFSRGTERRPFVSAQSKFSVLRNSRASRLKGKLPSAKKDTVFTSTTADASTNWMRNESRHLIELTNAVEQARLEKRVQKEREKLGLPESSAFSSQKKPSLFNQLRPSKQKDEKSSQTIEEKDNKNEEDEEDSFDLDDSSEEYDPSKPEKHKSDKNKSALSGLIQTSGNPENEIYLGKIPTILRKKIYPEAIASKTIGLEALMSSITSANLVCSEGGELKYIVDLLNIYYLWSQSVAPSFTFATFLGKLDAFHTDDLIRNSLINISSRLSTISRNRHISNDEPMEDELDEEESDIDIDDPLGEKVKKTLGKPKNEEEEIEFDETGKVELMEKDGISKEKHNNKQQKSEKEEEKHEEEEEEEEQLENLDEEEALQAQLEALHEANAHNSISSGNSNQTNGDNDEGDVFTLFMSRMKKAADEPAKENDSKKTASDSTYQPTEGEGSKQASRINRFKLLQKKKQEETTALTKQSQGKLKGEGATEGAKGESASGSKNAKEQNSTGDKEQVLSHEERKRRRRQALLEMEDDFRRQQEEEEREREAEKKRRNAKGNAEEGDDDGASQQPDLLLAELEGRLDEVLKTEENSKKEDEIPPKRKNLRRIASLDEDDDLI